VADTVRAAATALPELETAVAGLANEVDPAEILRIALAATYVDRLDGCRQALWRVIEDGRAGGALASAIQAMILVARYDSLTGHWDEARELLVEAIRLCDAIGYELFGWSARYIMAAIAALRGDYDAAKAMTDALLHWAEPRRIGAVAEYYSHVRALSALGKGDFEEAYQQAAAISEAGILSSQLASLAVMDFVESAVHTNRYAEAASHVMAMREVGLGKLSSRFALLVGGSAAMAAEQDEAAIALFKEALSIPGIDRWRCDVARVELAYGARLRRTRALAESRVHLGRAVETFERLGARPWADRARNELRASGQTRPRRGHHAMDALTAQEREIAQLAAAGLTNKQIGQRLFLSPRTVGGHLHRLFPKLGVSTRAALRDALNSLGQGQRGGSA
jgi:ATP/maltotriose-dependent transcriptional regulator MalT